MTEYVDLLRMPARDLARFFERRRKHQQLYRRSKSRLMKGLMAAPATMERREQPIVLMLRRISTHFPLGRFPQLYQEHEARPYHAVSLDRQLVGWRQSRYCLPLKRGSWVVMGRVKARSCIFSS